MKPPAVLLLAAAAALSGCLFPPAAHHLVLHVAPDGAAGADGSRNRPFGSLEAARDHVRAARAANTLPPGRITVLVRGGRYAVTNTFTLDRGDGGVDWRAARGETPVFSGGIRLRRFAPVADPALRARLPADVTDRVLQCDLNEIGITQLPPLTPGGFGSGRGFRTHPAPELYFNGRALPRAGWPDAGHAAVARVPTNETPVTIHGQRGSKAGRFGFDDPRLARWADEPALWLHGYWFWDWADSYEKVARIDAAGGEIELAPPLHTYGYRAGQPFRAVNALCELDQPGEWFLDTARRLLLFLPPSDPERAVVELSLFPGPLAQFDQLEDATFAGLVWELGAGDGVRVEKSSRVSLQDCTVRRCGGDGVLVSGGASNTLRGCVVHGMGRGALVVLGGDRRTLAPGGHRVERCTIHDLSRIDRTYTPGVLIGGVGQVVVHNEIHDVPSSALRVGGNDHLVAHNHIHHVVTESDDQGGVDMWGDPTFRGNVFVSNFFHDVGSAWNGGTEVKLGQAGIRLDDAISGVRIAHNRFERCGSGKTGFGAIQIHGGKDNLIEGNVFIDCAAAVSFSRWQAARWTNFVAGRMEKGDIDAELYLARYPALVKLLEEPNTVVIRDNRVVNGELLRRGHDAVREERNRIEAGKASR